MEDIYFTIAFIDVQIIIIAFVYLLYKEFKD